jgi:hypothetical protein
MKGVEYPKSKKRIAHPREFLPATRGTPGERSTFVSIVYQVFKTVSNQAILRSAAGCH